MALGADISVRFDEALKKPFLWSRNVHPRLLHICQQVSQSYYFPTLAHQVLES